MQSTGVSFWCLQVQKYKRESIPGPKVGLLGILGEIYFLVNGWSEFTICELVSCGIRAPDTHSHEEAKVVALYDYAPTIEGNIVGTTFAVLHWPETLVVLCTLLTIHWRGSLGGMKRCKVFHSRSPDVYISPQTSRIKLCVFNNPRQSTKSQLLAHGSMFVSGCIYLPALVFTQPLFLIITGHVSTVYRPSITLVLYEHWSS